MSEDSKRISKSVRKGDINKTISVEEVENGYIITFDKEYKDKKGMWQYESKKYISKENPLEEEKEKEEEFLSMKAFLASI